ncbi:Rhomboid family protein [Desulfatibacillum aliphaticivorans]|uniref:Rhomboid family protein n=1 Tax=Desulfatibacillum aliphaticivorans TaxID=218208 RepID=B8FLQ5_DESAL|nr:rhomboid family intramembrane serine protease [Desulfatibacillum aliphaticivorans]ACL05409.1 Rhomboid family protein [Desulfatibacillum aliphaticivorans]
MLVIPIEGKISWQNPPIVTILLIVINCFVFFGLQSGDDAIEANAFDFYFDSGLAGIEEEAYTEWLELRGEKLPVPGPPDLGADRSAYFYYVMISDDEYMSQLKSGSVITPADEQYAKWTALNLDFKKKLRRSFTERYSTTPAEHRPITFLTSMFLHGSVGHLLGNMIFLWIVGCVLEMGVGRLAYLAGYLCLGVFSDLVYWSVNLGSHIPCLGASGAISGLMGAMAVLYGMTRINVFLSTGFYFNYVKVPALFLLYFWVGKEFFSEYLGDPSNTAYMAHAGGLLGGALCGIAYKQIMGKKAKEFFEEQEPDETPELMEQAKTAIGSLEFSKARRPLEAVLEAKPNNLEALKLLFLVEKSQPENPSIHKTAARLLAALGGDSAAVADVYREYTAAVKRPALPAGLHLRLVKALARQGLLKEAEKIVGAFLRQKPDEPGVASALSALGHAYKSRGMDEKAAKCFRILERKYPRSQEAVLARSNAKT